MRINRTLCALAGGMLVFGALAASAGASFVQETRDQTGMHAAQFRVPSRFLYDPVINSITLNACPRIRLGDMSMASNQKATPHGT